MEPLDSQVLESYVPVYDVMPDTWELARPAIVEQLRKISTAINVREIGFFLDEELISGKSFIRGANQVADGGTSEQFRTILRKVVNFGALPAAGTKSVAHGIAFDNNFTLIQMWASATDPTNFLALPIVYADPVDLNNAIALNMDVTNINITVGTDRSSFSRCYVVIEYIQEL